MEVEDCLQSDHREEEGRPHDDGVRHLQLLLALVPEDAVQQHACMTGIKVSDCRYGEVSGHDNVDQNAGISSSYLLSYGRGPRGQT